MNNIVATLLMLAAAGCEPALDQRLDVIDSPTVIAVLAEPAEAAAGEVVTYTAVLATPAGPASADGTWAFCSASKPPTEDNIVAAACLGDLASVGTGASIVASLPVDGCQRFGPEPTPEGGRPRDPDATGGYYQPVRIRLDDDADTTAFGLHRLDCALANAPAAVARAYRERYTRNANPPAPMLARTDGQPLAAPVPADASVELTATWPLLAAEPYVSYDQATASLVDRRESLRVTWYITAGALALDASGVTEAAAANDHAAANVWHAPSIPGAVTLWAVLRDARGGAAVTTTTLTIE